MPALHPPHSSAVVRVSDERAEGLLGRGWTTADGGNDEPPPKAGRGSSRQAWADYATSQGVEVNDGWSRDDIIAAAEG